MVGARQGFEDDDIKKNVPSFSQGKFAMSSFQESTFKRQD